MNEEMINDSELTDEELAGQKLCEENRRLREALFCAVRGIPEEYREDMALLARSRAEILKVRRMRSLKDTAV